MILYGIPTCDTCRKAMKEIAAAGPAALLAAHPTLMKRPVIDADGALMLGWTDAVRARVLK
jgi:arsenate reductase-like glutaredoxin family protein